VIWSLPADAQVQGTGTPGTVPVWVDSTTIGDSIIQNGTAVTIPAPLQVTGTVTMDGGGGNIAVAGANGTGLSASGTSGGVVGTSSGSGAGVVGQGGSGAGVFGSSPSSDGVVGQANGMFGNGVSGHASGLQTNGVFGEVNATTGTGVGVLGVTAADHGTGVLGINNSTSAMGPGLYGENKTTTGSASAVVGQAHSPINAGVAGFNDSTTGGTGTYGEAGATTGIAFGVLGNAHGSNGIGVQGGAPFEGVVGVNQDCNDTGCNPAAGTAGVFTTGIGGNILRGNVAVSQTQWVSMFRVDDVGKGFFNGGTQTGGADFAESLAVTGERSQYEPGDVLTISTSGARQVALASESYSTLVAGIYSTKPGVLATPHTMDDPRLLSEIPLAVVGIVPCKVTAANGAIYPGDLLVTSSEAGHAMKGTDRNRMLGAVVGKALESLPSGTAVIQVLVTLQ
jgi:hypothetical protein